MRRGSQRNKGAAWRPHFRNRICDSVFVLLATAALAGCTQRASTAFGTPADAQGVREEAVKIASGKLTLAGTLFLPEGSQKHPAVVLFHGSGRRGAICSRRAGLQSKASRRWRTTNAAWANLKATFARCRSWSFATTGWRRLHISKGGKKWMRSALGCGASAKEGGWDPWRLRVRRTWRLRLQCQGQESRPASR